MKVIVIFEYDGVNCHSPQADDIINDITSFTIDNEGACGADSVYVQDAYNDEQTEEGEAQ